MIRRMRVENFRCWERAELEFGPLNVLVGPNDSGKTSLLEALVYLGRMGRSKPLPVARCERKTPPSDLEPVGLVVRDRRRDRDVAFEVEGEVGGEAFRHRLVLRPGPDDAADAMTVEERLDLAGREWCEVERELQVPLSFGAEERAVEPQPPPLPAAGSVVQRLSGRSSPEHAPLRALAASYRSLAIYRFDPRDLRRTDGSAGGLSPAGTNLPAALDAILRGPNRDRFDALEKELCRLLPSIAGIFLPLGKDNHPEVGFKLPSGARVGSAFVSDGVLLLLAYLALVYQDEPPLTLLIEEPENGLHPHRCGEVVGLLRDFAARPGRQVILTTHSPVLLNHFEPEEVFVCHREDGAPPRVAPMRDVEDLHELLEGFDVGELWYNLGERKLVPDEPGSHPPRR